MFDMLNLTITETHRRALKITTVALFIVLCIVSHAVFSV